MTLKTIVDKIQRVKRYNKNIKIICSANYGKDKPITYDYEYINSESFKLSHNGESWILTDNSWFNERLITELDIKIDTDEGIKSLYYAVNDTIPEFPDMPY